MEPQFFSVPFSFGLDVKRMASGLNFFCFEPRTDLAFLPYIGKNDSLRKLELSDYNASIYFLLAYFPKPGVFSKHIYIL